MNDIELAWDYIWLGQHFLPGLAQNVSGNIERSIDIKKTKGQDKATFTDNGYEPAKISITIEFLIQHWEEWEDIIDDIHPRKNGAVKTPLAIDHPALAMVGINQVYVNNISIPTVSNGIYSFTIQLIEYTPQPKATKTSSSGGSSEPKYGPGGWKITSSSSGIDDYVD